MKLGYLPCYVGSSIFPFDALFNEVKRVEAPEDVKGCDAIILWGGEDIWPGYYDQKAHPYNQNYGAASGRDNREWDAMMKAQDLGIPIIGVCRGAQFMCAFAGGSLVQHMTGHHNTHDVMCVPHGWSQGDGIKAAKVYQSSSEHHQMMYLEDMPASEYEVLAWAAGLSKLYQNDKGDMPVPSRGFFIEPEVVYFPNIKGLAIQGHPEWMQADEPFVEYVLKQVQDLLLTETV